MHTICCSHFTPDCVIHNHSDKNSIIFYNFVGNFIPPEWSTLSSHNGKILSKTARQLLSLIVFRMQIYYNNSIDELQETYHFFEEHLGVFQERVRQCLIELKKSGFIEFYKATIVKYGIKCRNTPCIKLARNFQPTSSKIPSENEKNFVPTPKNFGVKPKEILPQPQKSLDETIYIDNNKNISNKSRSSESTIFQNKKNESNYNSQTQLQEQKPEANLQCNVIKSINDEQQGDNISSSSANITTGATRINTALQAVIDNISKKYNPTESSSNNAAITATNHKSWFKRKKLADFYPLSQEDADLLQVKSNREFNLDFINKLLLKLAGEYSNHHFAHKKVLLNYG
ncbi:MAG: Phage-rep-O domain-containing protein [Rickettsia helvetica]|uniref:Phage-rep-O domain-containing protein n=1 Tax=Rickettsia helvetica TaxID=35789 RepID=A0ABP0T631_RICHE